MSFKDIRVAISREQLAAEYVVLDQHTEMCLDLYERVAALEEAIKPKDKEKD